MIDNSYSAVMSRKNEIMKRAVGMDYDTLCDEIVRLACGDKQKRKKGISC